MNTLIHTSTRPLPPANRPAYSHREIAGAAAKVLLPYLLMACILLLVR